MIRNGGEITEENWQDNGGCLGIWYTEPLSAEPKDLLNSYANDVYPRARLFSIRFKEAERIRKSYQTDQLIHCLGRLPVEEVLITSWSDYMFMAMEEVMSFMGGWAHFNFDIDGKAPELDNDIMPIWKSRKPQRGRFNIRYYLVNNKGLARTFNRKLDLSVRYDCSFERFLNSL